MKRWTRRKFIRASSAAAAVSVLSGCTLNLQRIEYLESYVEPPEEGLPGEDLWYATTCRQCQAGCGIIVRVCNGRPRKIEGNRLHPLNRGKICARGQAALQQLYDPDRLSNAVMQTTKGEIDPGGSRGSLEFHPILWDNALYELGTMLKRTPPAGISFLVGNASTHMNKLANRFMEAMGAPPPINYALSYETDGRVALAQAGQTLFNSEILPHYDLATADVVFSFGANLLETWLSPVSQSIAYSAMRRQSLGKRGYLVHFETRMSSTAACADEWIPIRPGTGGLVALGIGKLVSELLEQNIDQYQDINVRELAATSNVSTETLERLARIFIAHKRSLAIAGNALAGHSNDLASIKAVHALNQLANSWGSSGGVFIPRQEMASVTPSSFIEMVDLVNRMNAGSVQVLLIHGFNPLYELPKALGFMDALTNVPQVVYFGSSIDETASQADLVLPDHTNLEGWGYHVPLGADRPTISGQQPVTRPIYDTRSTVDVILALAGRLGLQDQLPWANEIDYVEALVSELAISWQQWRRQGGWWEQEPNETKPNVVEINLNVRLPIFEGAQERYPFHLYPYPSIVLADGRGTNKAWLQETPDPMTTMSWQSWVEIHPDTAGGLGISDGDVVRLSSPAGSLEAIAYLFHGVPKDVLAMPIGWGHTHYGRFAKDYGSNPIQLLVPVTSDDTGSLAWGATRVNIEKTDKVRKLPRLENAEGVEYLRNSEEH